MVIHKFASKEVLKSDCIVADGNTSERSYYLHPKRIQYKQEDQRFQYKIHKLEPYHILAEQKRAQHFLAIHDLKTCHGALSAVICSVILGLLIVTFLTAHSPMIT